MIGPRSPVIAVVEEEIVLPCQLSPPRDAGDMEVRWYRAHSPGLVLRYPSPQDPAEPQRQDYRARAEVLLENATRGLVSLRVRPVHASDGGEYTCFFESPTYYNEAKFEVLVTGEPLQRNSQSVFFFGPVSNQQCRNSCRAQMVGFTQTPRWATKLSQRRDSPDELPSAPADYRRNIFTSVFFVNTIA